MVYFVLHNTSFLSGSHKLRGASYLYGRRKISGQCGRVYRSAYLEGGASFAGSARIFSFCVRMVSKMDGFFCRLFQPFYPGEGFFTLSAWRAGWSVQPGKCRNCFASLPGPFADTASFPIRARPTFSNACPPRGIRLKRLRFSQGPFRLWQSPPEWFPLPLPDLPADGRSGPRRLRPPFLAA